MCNCIGDALLLLPLLASGRVSAAHATVCSYELSAAVHHLVMQSLIVIDDSLTGEFLTLSVITLS